MRIISVVIGESDSKTRFKEVSESFDYAFANYTNTPIVEANVAIDGTAEVICGKQKQVSVCPIRSSYAFCRRGEKGEYKLETIIQPQRAPLQKGSVVGEIIVYKDSVEVDSIPLIAMESVDKANLFERWKEIAKNWNAR